MNHIQTHRFSNIHNLGELRKAVDAVKHWPPGYGVVVRNDTIEIWYDSDEYPIEPK